MSLQWPMFAHDATYSRYYHQGQIPDPVFLRGDGNRDSTVDISDVIAISTFLFQNAASDCPAQMDVNADNKVNLSDPIDLLAYLFLGGLAPEPPFPECGTGPQSTLRCLEFVCP